MVVYVCMCEKEIKGTGIADTENVFWNMSSERKNGGR